MAYYIRATCNLNEENREKIGQNNLVLGLYLKVMGQDAPPTAVASARGPFAGDGIAIYYLNTGCPSVDFRGNWELLREDMFNQEEKMMLQMLIPDLEWWVNE